MEIENLAKITTYLALLKRYLTIRCCRADKTLCGAEVFCVD